MTTGPVLSGAKLVISRVDGKVFAFTSFTAKLLANTAATGAAIEIMPSVNGQAGFNEPLYFDTSGYRGSEFSYNTSPNYLGSTALLTNFDAYAITLFVDYAQTALTVETINEWPTLQPLVLAGYQQLGVTNMVSLTWTNAGTACLPESAGALPGGWSTVTSPWRTNGYWVSTEVTNTSAAQFVRLRGL